jgi:hypothetical protein
MHIRDGGEWSWMVQGLFGINCSCMVQCWVCMQLAKRFEPDMGKIVARTMRWFLWIRGIMLGLLGSSERVRTLLNRTIDDEMWYRIEKIVRSAIILVKKTC